MTAPRIEPPACSSLKPPPGRATCRQRSSIPPLALAAFFFIASPAHAGGMDHIAEPSDPCIPIADDTMTGEMLRGWRAVQAMKADLCGPPVFIDRASGLPLTDDEILARVFNGHRPAVVPLPAGVWLLMAGLGALTTIRRKS